MYLRTTTRRASDGTVVRYVQLAHNRRVNGVTQAQVLVNLGREEHLDPEGLRRLVRSIRRWLGDADAGPDDARGRAAGPQVVDVRPVGTVWLLDGLWKAAGVDRFVFIHNPLRAIGATASNAPATALANVRARTVAPNA